MTPKLIQDAIVEPLTFDDIVEHARIPFDQEKRLVERYIRAARASCEDYIDGTISPKTLEIVSDKYSSTIELPLGPITAVLSIKYIDASGVEQTLDPTTYVLDGYRRSATLRLAYGASWPIARTQFDAIKIRYRAGYAIDDSPAATVPEPIVQAMRLLIAESIDYKSAVDLDNLAVLPLGVKYLLDPYRLQMGL